MKNKKILFAFLIFFVFIPSLFLFSARSVNAQGFCEMVTISPVEVVVGSSIDIIFKKLATGKYTIEFERNFIDTIEPDNPEFTVDDKTNFPLKQTFYTKDSDFGFVDNTFVIHLKKDDEFYNLCEGRTNGGIGSFKLVSPEGYSYKNPEYSITITGSSNDNPNCIDANSTVKIDFENFKRVFNDGSEEPIDNMNAGVKLLDRSSSEIADLKVATVEEGKFSVTFGPDLSPSEDGTSLKILLKTTGGGGSGFEEITDLPFMPIRIVCGEKDNDRVSSTSGPIDLGIYEICQGDLDCEACFKTKEKGGVYENGGAWTALGCIPTEPMDLVKWLFPYLLGFGGLAAFGLIVFSGIQLMTSSGDPQKIQGAKETITSAVTGLIFVILSLFLLRLIGVNILGLPGLK